MICWNTLTASRTVGFFFVCLCSCAFTNYVLSFQLAYCVVQFMEKDATVTEYVRVLQCLINVSLCCHYAPMKSYFAIGNAEITAWIMQPQRMIPSMRDLDFFFQTLQWLLHHLLRSLVCSAVIDRYCLILYVLGAKAWLAAIVVPLQSQLSSYWKSIFPNNQLHTYKVKT